MQCFCHLVPHTGWPARIFGYRLASTNLIPLIPPDTHRHVPLIPPDTHRHVQVPDTHRHVQVPMGLFGKYGMHEIPPLASPLLQDIQLRLSQWDCGVPLAQHGTLQQARGGGQFQEPFRARAIPGQQGKRWDR
jgi:hypothetical protein